MGGRYVPTGHLVFVRASRLWAARFDPQQLMLTTAPVPVIEGIREEIGGAIQFSVSDEGTLVYIPGMLGPAARELTWVGRDGREERINAPPRVYFYPRISPDGMRVALDVRDQDDDIWTWDFARRTLTRLTFSGGPDEYPEWTPDAHRIIFSSAREKTMGPYWQAADGTGAVERLTTDQRQLSQAAVAPDGQHLVLTAATGASGGDEDLVLLALDGERRISPLLHGPFLERNPAISPDGRWLAYQSAESGGFEIYVRPFPQVDGGRWQISADGGTQPAWSPDGQELFYLGFDQQTLMRVSVESGAVFRPGTPERLLDLSSEYSLSAVGRNYDISRDGRRFLMTKAHAPATRPEINVVVNWFEELKRLVPGN
jgi:serine/threonine-protein kinase